MLDATLMLGGIPIFATAAAWSGVPHPVIAPLIVALAIAATALSGWGGQLAAQRTQARLEPPEGPS